MIDWVRKRLRELSGQPSGKIIDFPQTPENLDRLASSRTLLKSDDYTTDPLYDSLTKKK